MVKASHDRETTASVDRTAYVAHSARAHTHTLTHTLTHTNTHTHTHSHTLANASKQQQHGTKYGKNVRRRAHLSGGDAKTAGEEEVGQAEELGHVTEVGRHGPHVEPDEELAQLHLHEHRRVVANLFKERKGKKRWESKRVGVDTINDRRLRTTSIN